MTSLPRDPQTAISDPPPEEAAAIRALAHELRNTHHVMRFGARSLRKRLDALDLAADPGVHKQLARIDAGLARAAALVARARDWLTLGAPALEALDLRALAERVSAEALEGTEGVRVTWDVAADLAPVAADEDQLAIALRGLLDNAVAQLPDGGALTLTLTQQPTSATFRVRDSGPGLPDPALHDDVRLPFVTTSPDRLGLGLPIAERIARRHGGSLVVADHPAGGVEAALSVPAWRPS